MSLYGSGRREGILAVAALVALALLVHAAGSCFGLGDGSAGDQALASAMATAHAVLERGEVPLWDPSATGAPLWTRGAELLYPPWWLLGRGDDGMWLLALLALHGAIACALAYRFLRAQGRSRYAGFLGGALYGLSAYVGTLSGNLPEVAALAWAPLPIEVLLRIVRGERQRHVAAFLGMTLALVFVTGGTVTATCTAGLVAAWLARAALHDRARRRELTATWIGTATTTALLTAPLWLTIAEVPPLPVAATAPAADPWLSLLRVAGPLSAFLAVLGILRSQRHVQLRTWVLIAALGAFNAILLPYVPLPFDGREPWREVPEALWWPTHLALTLLAASGLDDFLDNPARRRAALAWLLLACLLLGPLGFWLGAEDQRFHIEAAVLLAVAALFSAWRPLGILGFKTVLTGAAVVWLAVATLHEQARAGRAPKPLPWCLESGPLAMPPAMPGFEGAPPLLPPPRARIAFSLAPATGRLPPAPLLPRPTGAATVIAGLPADFRPAADAAARATIEREGANWSEYRVEMHGGHGALVVADTYARGWHATRNGQPVPVLRANYAERAVLLPGGSHLVRFEYRPAALTLGPKLAGSGILLALLWALVSATLRLFRGG